MSEMLPIEYDAGESVLILDRGEWIGPFLVTDNVGRTPDHLVLYNAKNGTYFEHYNDAPYNTKRA